MCEDSLVAPPVDRRTSTRQPASIPVAIMSDDWSIFAIIEDVSETGALLLAREELEVGTPVRIHVLLGTRVRPAVTAEAQVIRSQPRDGVGLLWSHEVAVQFERQSGPWNEALSAVAQRQAELRCTDD